MFFDSWSSLLRIVIVGAFAYAGLVALLRVFGKRMLSKMNAFDLVVTVALGSTLSSVIISKDVALANGLLALLVLLVLQFLLAWAAARSARVERIIKSEPALVFFRGRFLEGAMRNEKVTAGDVLACMRAQGIASPEEVEAVVLEADGSMNVISSGAEPGETTTLRDVRNLPGRHVGKE